MKAIEKMVLPELPILDDFALFLNFLRRYQKVPLTGTCPNLKMADLYRLNEELHFKADWEPPQPATALPCSSSSKMILWVLWFLGLCELHPDPSLTSQPDPYAFI